MFLKEAMMNKREKRWQTRAIKKTRYGEIENE